MAETPPTGPDDRRPPSYDAGREGYVGISSGALDSVDDLRDARAFAEMVVDTVHEPLLVLTSDLSVRTANRAFYEHFEVDPDETIGRRVYDLGNGQWDIPALRDLLEDVLPDNTAFDDYEVRHEFEDLGERVMLLNGRRLDHVQLVLLGIRDVTEQRRVEAERRQSGEWREYLLKLSDALRPLADPAAIEAEACRLLGEHLGVDRAYYVGVDEAGGQARVRYNHLRGDSPSLLGAFPLEEVGWTVPYLRRGEAVVVADAQSDDLVPDEDRGRMAELQMCAHISIPVVKDGALMGALCVTESAPRAWTEAEVTLVSETAERVWAALVRGRSEAALRESEERFRTYLTNASVVFAQVDADLRYASIFNPHPDFDPDAVIGKRDDELDAGPGIDALVALKRRVLERGEPERQEVTFVRSDGDRTYDITVSPAVDPEGGVQHLITASIDVTEQKRAEEALRESEERQAFLLRLSDALRAEPSADAVADRALRMLSEQMGLDRCWISEVSEQEGVSRVGPEQLRPDLPPMSGVYQLSDYPETMRQLATQPVAVQDAAGDPRFPDSERELLAGLHLGALLAAPLREGERRVVWALAAATDTPRRWTDGERVLLEDVAERTWAAVERARAEEALRESGRLARERLDELEATYAAAPVGLCVLDRDLRYRRINRRLAEINGRSVEEHLGRTVREIVPDLADAVEPVFRQIFETGEPVLDIEITGETAAQPGVERVWVESWLPLRDAAGEVVGINIVAEEVTERKRTEAALLESEGRFRTLAETVPDAVFTATADGAVDYVNRQHTLLTGAEPDEVIGTTMWPDLVHPDDREAAEAAWEAACQNAERFEVRYRLRSADGVYCWVIVRARPVFDDDGALAKWFGAVTDVDALARAEEAVRQLNATLECRVEERTREVRQMAARLATAEQAERERIARVLHDDLQQQLVGLSMTLDLLRRPAASSGGGGDDEAEAVAEAARLADQADEVLGGAIDTARTLASELSPAVLESTRVGDLLEWLALRKEAQHGMDVAVEVEGPCEVADRALRVLLYQVLQEALLNVVKHAGTKRATLRAWTDDGLATVQVEDDGAGFDLGRQRARQRAEPGGFGLPHVRERVERAGGWLAVDSAPGEGTRVTVAVPSGAPDNGP